MRRKVNVEKAAKTDAISLYHPALLLGGGLVVCGEVFL